MSDLDPQTDDRYRFIDFLLLFKGRLSRSELVKRFAIGEATASRTISGFLKVYPDVVEYLGPRKGYAVKKGFSPAYQHNAKEGLRYIASGVLHQTIEIECYGATHHNLQRQLDVECVSAITRAIISQHEVSIQYVSATSGAKTRSVVPHAVFTAGGAWYFRAYDVSTYEFKTFKFTRLAAAYTIGKAESAKHLSKRDDAWYRMRIVKLTPHPRNPSPDAQWLDLDVKDGHVKELLVSEACLGFVLTDLRVDCSKGNKLGCYEYPLVLKNREELKGIDSMSIAPGFGL
jgi:hypothetical protein